jgi:hypothetical protein
MDKHLESLAIGLFSVSPSKINSFNFLLRDSCLKLIFTMKQIDVAQMLHPLRGSVCYFYDFSRFPWRRLQDTICYRQPCSSDSDCCLQYNICDRSALVCVDCWYGSACYTESECCRKYPFCRHTPSMKDPQSTVGECVDHVN